MLSPETKHIIRAKTISLATFVFAHLYPVCIYVNTCTAAQHTRALTCSELRLLGPNSKYYLPVWKLTQFLPHSKGDSRESNGERSEKHKTTLEGFFFNTKFTNFNLNDFKHISEYTYGEVWRVPKEKYLGPKIICRVRLKGNSFSSFQGPLHQDYTFKLKRITYKPCPYGFRHLQSCVLPEETACPGETCHRNGHREPPTLQSQFSKHPF